MWPKSYRDYPNDTPLIQETVEPKKGIIGCEMHDLNGWGMAFHRSRPPKRGFFYRLFSRLFKRFL